MNDAHLHLLLVHIPIVLVPFGATLLLLGSWRQSQSLQAVSYFTFITAALFAFTAYQFGEGAEELVEHINGIAKSTIETHEAAATKALWVTIILGLDSIFTLACVRFKQNLLRFLAPSVLVLSLGASVLLAITAQAGGKIRHPEAFDEQPTAVGTAITSGHAE